MRTYWMGELRSQDDWKTDPACWSMLEFKKKTFFDTKLDLIIQTLDQFSQLWDPSHEIFKAAIPRLVSESDFTHEEVVSTLSLLKGLMSREALYKRVKAEFGNQEVLDRFCKMPSFDGQVRAVPKGTLLHVTAGNVFLSSIDSLIMGFLTKNISLLKVSSQNQFFPFYFAETLKAFDKKNILSDKFAILHWKGGDRQTEELVKKKVDAIIAWGGEEMIQSYRTDLPINVKFLDFGPKISFQLITRKGLVGKNLQKVAEAIVHDIIPWDQGACASPQNLFLQEGIDQTSLIKAIDEEFSKAPARGSLSDDESVEILKEKYRALYSELVEGGALSEGKNHLVHFERNKFLKPSPLGRSLIIKNFSSLEDLNQHIRPFSFYLQSCSYLLEKSEQEEFLNTLSLAGIKRFAPLGTITWGMEGAPHDGRIVLRELVSFVGNELRVRDFGESIERIHNSSDLKGQFESRKHPQGFIFSSGGTTGEPKYVHYSYEEFDRITDMLAYNFSAQGISAGTTVANLFVAGNLWSSFIAVEKALEKIGAIQLPIGGMCPAENIVKYLSKFKPQVVMGIPSMLVLNAELSASLGINLDIPNVFYAGEALSLARRDYLKQVWKTEYFGSAGYASVDAGVIGYQCSSCGPGEHHLFSDLIELKIVDEQAIVTSLLRDTLEIKNYATGDRVEWISDCDCGRKDRRFKLLGRIDNTILIWSCRLMLEGIEAALRKFNPNILSYQVVLTETRTSTGVTEFLDLVYEAHSYEALNADQVASEIYQTSRDLKDTISLEAFKSKFQLTKVGHGEIARNPRTGKISTILDKRK